MKRILYDMGPQDTCQMASLESYKGLTHPSDQDPGWEGLNHQKVDKIGVS